MANPVVHFEVGGKDPDKLRNFYGKLFKWEFDVVPEMNYGLVAAAGDNSIGGGVGPAPEGGRPYVTFYVQCENLDAYLKRVESLGGKQLVPPTPIPDGEIAMFTDPEGNAVGLYRQT